MLRVYVLEFGGSWDMHLPLLKFAYNNSYHSNIGMAPYEAFNGRPCRSPTCWNDVVNRHPFGPDLIQDTVHKIAIICKNLLTT